MLSKNKYFTFNSAGSMSWSRISVTLKVYSLGVPDELNTPNLALEEIKRQDSDSKITFIEDFPISSAAYVNSFILSGFS